MSEWLLDGLSDGVEHPGAVLIVDQTIPQDSHCLVSPQPHEPVWLVDLFLRHRRDTADNLAEITEVEGVVGLCWGRLQVVLNLLVDLERGIHNLSLQGGALRRELTHSEEPSQNRSEDAFHGFVFEECEANNVEMPLHTRRDVGLARSGEPHCADEHGIDERSERMLVILQIVPSLLLHHLSQDFDGRLRTELLELWHVQIVDKDDHLHAEPSAKDSLPSLLKFAIDDVLHLVAAGLGREANLYGAEFLSRQLAEQDILNIFGFPCTGWPAEKSWDFVLDAVLLNEAVADRINRCHNNILRDGVSREVVNLIPICEV